MIEGWTPKQFVRLRTDAAAYHALNAELDKQMAAKPDNY